MAWHGGDGRFPKRKRAIFVYNAFEFQFCQIAEYICIKNRIDNNIG